MVLSVSGSATITVWNRRSNALSFSKYLLIFVQSSGSYAAELTTGQGGFQYIGGIRGTFTFTGSDQGMDFIDKQDDAAFGFDYFIDNRFQTFFKFTFVFGSGNQCAHIQ